MAQDDLIKRVPPHSLDAEQACIGAMFVSAEAISEVRQVLVASDFYDEKNQILYNSIAELNDRNIPVDVVTVSERLSAAGRLEKAGGGSYLSRLLESVPASSNVLTYAKIVMEKSMLRQLINAARTIIDNVYENASDIEKVFDDAERKIFEVTDRRLRTDYYHIKDIVNTTLKHIGTLHDSEHAYTGLPTHYKDLDELTGGLQKGDLIVLAARPGMGKTAFALNLAANLFKHGKKPTVLFYSLEMVYQELVLRMLASESRLNMGKIKMGRLNDKTGEWDELVRAAGKLSTMNIFVDDKPMISLNEIRALSRRIKGKHGLDLILIDHLQLISTSEGNKSFNNTNRNNELAYISKSLKALAKELEIPIITLSQLSRMVESRHPPIPKLSDLRESGAIEQDADIVAFLYRDEYYNKENTTKPGVAELMIEKHRNGPQGIVELTFNKESVRFDDLAKHYEYLEGESNPNDDSSF